MSTAVLVQTLHIAASAAAGVASISSKLSSQVHSCCIHDGLSGKLLLQSSNCTHCCLLLSAGPQTALPSGSCSPVCSAGGSAPCWFSLDVYFSTEILKNHQELLIVHVIVLIQILFHTFDKYHSGQSFRCVAAQAWKWSRLCAYFILQVFLIHSQWTAGSTHCICVCLFEH